MLRYQLNPHFLFNALNSIRTLVHEDILKADQMITDLSEFLRYSLSNEGSNEVSLKEEIEIIPQYFEYNDVIILNASTIKFTKIRNIKLITAEGDYLTFIQSWLIISPKHN
jgi:hypothetical protein